MIKRCKAYILKDIDLASVNADFDGRDSLSLKEGNPEIYNNQVATVCMVYNPNDGLLYLGLTAWTTDILYTFDPATKQFQSLGYDRISEPYEVKCHRSLELASDGTIWFATACLHEVNHRFDAPGGAIGKIPASTRTPEKVAIPCKHDYIQTITLDDKRGLIYGQTYPVFKFFVYDIESGRVDDHDYMGSISHVSALDDDGCFWSTWGFGHRFYKYDPATRKITFFNGRMPNSVQDSNIMYPGAGPVDVMVNGGDGNLYIGSCGGSLCKLDPTSGEATYLGHPAPTRRAPGLIHYRDSLLLGICGDEDGGTVYTYDMETGLIKVIGAIQDSDTGLKLYRVHDVRKGPGNTIYVGETDVPTRSGYLWECEIDV
jgi:hypothetical protein